MATILVVDDRQVDRELLVMLLEHARHRVLEAADGHEALRLLHAENPDLVISDVLLPTMDGYELVRRVRGIPSIAHTRIIFYTAVFNEREAREFARSCGVSRILAKPTVPEKILDTVADVLKTGEETLSVPEHFEWTHQQLLRHKILEQKDALLQSEERFRLLAENATDMIFRCRLQPGFACEYLNPAVTKMLGYDPCEFYTDPELLFKIVHPESRQELEEFMGGTPAPMVQIRWRHKNGRSVWTEIRCTRFYGENQGVVAAVEGMARDITEQRHAEEAREEYLAQMSALLSEREELLAEISKSRDELEERVRERTAELENANRELNAYAERLEHLNEDLQEFAFVASHDLQEPLRKIQTFSTLIGSSCADSLSDTGRDYLKRMEKAAQRMRILLNDLLKLSRVSTKTEPFTSVDLAKPIREVLSDLSVLIEQKGGIVELSDLPVIESDESQMRQLFQNLISNAFKYNEQENPVVRIYGSGCNDGRCTICVEDNGIGFEEEFVDRIFKPFQRLHGRSSSYEGTGMGLAICRKITERHKGDITARSTPGRGSVFIVTLPQWQRG